MDYFLIFIVALSRVLPHPPNVTPVAALALFGGAFLSRRFALLYPLLIMIVSDLALNLLLGVSWFLPESLFVYGSFLITGLLGLWCRSRRSIGILYLAAVASSIQFYLITNFGTWLVSGMYSKNIAGLLQCYTMAIPFFRNTLMGNLFWFSVLWGTYHLAHRLIPHRSRISV